MTNDNRDPPNEDDYHDHHGGVGESNAGGPKSAADERVITLIAAVTLTAVIAIIVYAGWRY